MRIFKELSQERWNTFSIVKQLANVGTDIDRAIQWKKQGNIEYSQKSFEAALELLAMTIIDPKNKGCRRRELARVRELFIDYFMYGNEYATSDAMWRDYFYTYICAAAWERKNIQQCSAKERHY